MSGKQQEPTIRRGPRNAHYTQLPNRVLEDTEISAEARWLVAYLLSKPDHWILRRTNIEKMVPCGRDKAYKLIKELVKRGYVQREINRDGGKFNAVQYVIYDEPVSPPETCDKNAPHTDLPDTANPDTASPFPALPDPVNQEPSNTESLVSTDSVSNTDSKQGRESACARDRVEENPSPNSGHGIAPEANNAADNRDRPSPKTGHGAVGPEDRALTKTARRKLNDRAVAAWPPNTGSTEHAIAELNKLGDGDLVKAVERIPLWLAEWRTVPRRHTPALSTYVRERRFDTVEPKPEPPPATTESASAGSRLFNARLYQILLTTAVLDPLPPATGYLQTQIEKGGRLGEIARLRHQAHCGWPEARRMASAAAGGQGYSVSLDLQRLADRFGSVKAGTPLWDAWRNHHERQGWPWVHDGGGAWLPVPSDPDGYEGDEAGFVIAALAELKTALEAMSGTSEDSGDDASAA